LTETDTLRDATGSRNMASDIDRTIATARRFMAVVQYFLHFIWTSQGIGFCNIECQMLNVERNLTNVTSCWLLILPVDIIN